jgi:adenosine deaminase
MAVHDAGVMNLLRERNVLLEVCPTSNWMCRCISSYADHPIRHLMNAGIQCAIGTDDPGIFGMGQGERPGDNITLNHEYAFLCETLGMTESDLMLCNERAAAASFLSAEEKHRVWPSCNGEKDGDTK